MADISLRDYLAKLDTLLKSGSAAEVILHCRHILQYFPKDAQAYRLLGQALVATSRWPEAGEIMRRVLSIFPDDREAHAGLSEVYRIEKRPDDAIWHLERAFEQTPNDQTILDNLRELYRKYRKTEHGKVQLTTAAVARQYIRNGLYDQAIDTLQKARTLSPERLDLPLLLAQTYWDRGQRVEAAETALDVLKVLPDCLVANTLLAAMWLTESRPSDAQRYIGRIESLDPYLALELAQGQDVPDNAFKLPELDYQRAAEREMNLQTPDWLGMTGNGDTQAPEEDFNAVPDFFNDITVDEDVVAKQSFGGPLTSEQWGTTSDDLPYLGDDSSPTIPKPTGSLTGLAGRFGKPQTGMLPPQPPAKPNIPGPKRGLTGRLTPLPEQTPQPEPVASESLPSFMEDSAPTASGYSSPDETGTIYTGDLPDLSSLVPQSVAPEEELPFRRERSTQPEDNDPLAWLRSSGVEINEDAAVDADDDLYDAEADNFALREADAVDPLNWLQGYGGNELVVPPDKPNAIRSTDELPLAEDQAGDPLAWLQNSEPAASTPISAAASPVDDPLDWLSDESLLDEAFDLESLVNNQTSLPEQSPLEADVSSTAATPEWQDTMADEKDPLDWLSSDPEPEAEPSDSFTWMEDDPTIAAEPSQTDFPDWLNASATHTEVVDGVGSSSENDIDWMTDLPDLGTNEPAEEAKPVGSSMLNWLGKETVDAPDMPMMEQPDSSTPDWLGELQIESHEPEPSASSKVDENGFEWMSTADELPPIATSSDIPGWLSSMDLGDVADEPEAEAEPLAAADTPDWLSSMDVADEPEAEAEPLAIADAPDWLSSMDVTDEPEAEAEAEPLPAADTPDWLSSMQPDDEPELEAEPLPADAPDWLSAMQPDEPQAEAEPLAMADTPDWLSSMDVADEPEAEAEPLAIADTPDWLSSMDVTDEPEAAAAAAAADAPDWLSAMQPDDEPQAEAEPLAAADTPDWLSSMNVPDEPETEAEPILAADTPDWLSAMQPDDEPEAEAEPLAAADTPDWLSSMDVADELEAEAEPILAADTPDWLSAMQPDDELETEAEPLAADTPDWLSAMQPDELEPEAEAEPLAAADAPDWLSSMDMGTELEDEAEPLAVADTPDWLSAMQPDDELEDEPITASIVDDTPDWLTAMQQPTEEQLAAPVTSNNISGWLDDNMEADAMSEAEQPMTDEEWTEAGELSPEMTADTPDWLSAMNDASQKTATSDDSYQWDDGSPEESMPAAPAPASNAPDWLNAMVPGLDVDYDAPEDEPVETEFLPTNRAASPKPAPGKEGKTRPEFGWLLDIVSEESQQVTVVADKTALRRFVFSRLPTWLRKPTERPDKSSESEADNVDIPPWLQ